MYELEAARAKQSQSPKCTNLPDLELSTAAQELITALIGRASGREFASQDAAVAYVTNTFGGGEMTAITLHIDEYQDSPALAQVKAVCTFDLLICKLGAYSRSKRIQYPLYGLLLSQRHLYRHLDEPVQRRAENQPSACSNLAVGSAVYRGQLADLATDI